MARDAAVETMRWFTTDACYVFHPMNAWEEGDRIFADVMEYPVAPLFPNADGSMPQRASARLVRWTFDLAAASDTIKREPLDDLAANFPASTNGAGSDYRHGWFAGRAGGREGGAFAVRASPMSTSRPESGRPTFRRRRRSGRAGLRAPLGRCAGRRRMDRRRGLSRAEDRSDFVVFDAGAIEAGPIGVARLPRRVPFGFHGNWRPA